jgi:glycosyltransferase involved in cell wall biosynthesis
MKILYVINQLHSGGAEQQMVALCEGVRRRGHHVEVASIYDRLDLRNRLDAVQTPITVVHKYAKLDITVIWRIRHLIQEKKPDLVHAYLPASCLFVGLTKWLGITAPVLQSERSINNWRSPWRLWLDNVVRNRVANITCNADAIKRYLSAEEGVDPQKTTLIYNGLVKERRTRPEQQAIDAARCKVNLPDGASIVIAVANFVREKQFPVLLRSFAQAKEQVGGLFLVLVGKGPLEGEIRKDITELGLTDSVRIVSDCVNPLPLLCIANTAVSTSSIEGCSNSILEAMAMGLPVVASNAGGNAELVTHELGGFVGPIGNSKVFADSLVRLAQDPILVQRMGHYNRKKIEREFTDDIMVDRTLALYECILRETPPAVKARFFLNRLSPGSN